jgi:hypothetical protein
MNIHRSPCFNSLVVKVIFFRIGSTISTAYLLYKVNYVKNNERPPIWSLLMMMYTQKMVPVYISFEYSSFSLFQFTISFHSDIIWSHIIPFKGAQNINHNIIFCSLNETVVVVLINNDFWSLLMMMYTQKMVPVWSLYCLISYLFWRALKEKNNKSLLIRTTTTVSLRLQNIMLWFIFCAPLKTLMMF